MKKGPGFALSSIGRAPSLNPHEESQDMRNLVSGNSSVNGAVGEVLQFADDMASRGEYSDSTARNYRGAFGKLSEVCAPDECADASWCLEHVDDMGRRWGVKNSAKPDTIRTYVTRARSLLEDFHRYKADPVSFRGRSRKPAGDGEERSRRRSDSAKKEVTPDAAGTAPRAWSQTYPTTSGPFVVQVPTDENGFPNYTSEDLGRIAMSLLPLARDFAPGDPRHARLFSSLKLSPSAE